MAANKLVVSCRGWRANHEIRLIERYPVDDNTRSPQFADFNVPPVIKHSRDGEVSRLTKEIVLTCRARCRPQSDDGRSRGADYDALGRVIVCSTDNIELQHRHRLGLGYRQHQHRTKRRRHNRHKCTVQSTSISGKTAAD